MSWPRPRHTVARFAPRLSPAAPAPLTPGPGRRCCAIPLLTQWITVGTRWLWILGTSLLVTAFPLLLEVEREQQARDVESAQVDFLRRQGYSPDQLAQIGLGEGGASA